MYQILTVNMAYSIIHAMDDSFYPPLLYLHVQ